MKTRIDLLKSFEKKLIIAELGVFKGEFSSQIINICNPNKLYLVDIFSGRVESGDVNGNNIISINGEELKKIVENKFSSNTKVKIIKSCSVEFLKSLEENYLDVVYIDSSHQYEHTKKELEESFFKVKKNGFICGHDYHPRFNGVVRAVNEFCEEKKLNLSLTKNDGLNSFFIKLLK